MEDAAKHIFPGDVLILVGQGFLGDYFSSNLLPGGGLGSPSEEPCVAGSSVEL